MKNFFKIKSMVNGLAITLIVILGFIVGYNIMDFLDEDDGGGADIGGGLMILLFPVLICFLIGLWRGSRGAKFKGETWIWAFIVTTILQVICMVAAATIFRNEDIFLISTTLVPFDSIIVFIYYMSGFFGESLGSTKFKSNNPDNVL